MSSKHCLENRWAVILCKNRLCVCMLLRHCRHSVASAFQYCYFLLKKYWKPRILFLACLAYLSSGLYILPSIISFFLLFILISFLSLTISRRQIISGSAGPIFAIFSPTESSLGVQGAPIKTIP